MKKVLIVCRGSVSDGLGHVTRSRTVARRYAEVASTRMLVMGDGCADALLAGRGLDYDCRATEESVARCVEDWRPDIVVFDLLRFPRELVRRFASVSLVVSLSPIFDSLAEAHVLFHRTSRLGPSWNFTAGGPLLRCGLEYSVVSTHCLRIPDDTYFSHLAEQPLAIAVSMGGTDAANKTVAVLERLCTLERKLLIWAMLGEGYAHSYQALVDCTKGSAHEILLAKTNDSMWRVLRTCSLAILAAGTTSYEAVYAGLPSINLLENGERRFLIDELVQNGASLCPGVDFESGLRELPALVLDLETNRSALKTMHSQCHSLIDGEGAKRIVSETLELVASKAVVC